MTHLPTESTDISEESMASEREATCLLSTPEAGSDHHWLPLLIADQPILLLKQNTHQITPGHPYIFIHTYHVIHIYIHTYIETTSERKTTYTICLYSKLAHTSFIQSLTSSLRVSVICIYLYINAIYI